MPNDTHLFGNGGGDAVIRFGVKFWAGLFSIAWGPAMLCLGAFWHLSDRVLLVETRLESQTGILLKMTNTIEKLDGNREALAVAIAEIKEVKATMYRIEDRQQRNAKTQGE